MENKRAIIIIGGSRSGKSFRAREEAEKRGADYGVISWDEISDGKFGLGRAMALEPKIIIVEGLPAGVLLHEKLNFLKQLVSGEDLLIEQKYKDPKTVPSPLFIFTMLTPSKYELGQTIYSRVEVIRL